MYRKLAYIWEDERAASTPEYGLLLALLCLACVTATKELADQVTRFFLKAAFIVQESAGG